MENNNTQENLNNNININVTNNENEKKGLPIYILPVIIVLIISIVGGIFLSKMDFSSDEVASTPNDDKITNVEEYAKSINSTDEKLLNFYEYSKTFYQESSYKKSYEQIMFHLNMPFASETRMMLSYAKNTVMTGGIIVAVLALLFCHKYKLHIKLIDKLLTFGFDIRVLDIGGGYKLNYLEFLIVTSLLSFRPAMPVPMPCRKFLHQRIRYCQCK